MQKINIPEEIIAQAEGFYEFKALKNSITNGVSNIYGAVGELLIYNLFKLKGYTVDFNSTYDYDLIINGLKVDVKTKKTTVEPKENYLCSIAAYNTRQECDYYFFVRVDLEKRIGYFLGYIKKEDFFRKATFRQKGESDGNWEFKADCYNLEVKYLKNAST